MAERSRFAICVWTHLHYMLRAINNSLYYIIVTDVTKFVVHTPKRDTHADNSDMLDSFG